MSAITLINQLKKENQDFEFYPTTNEILDAVYWDIKSHKINIGYGDKSIVERKGVDIQYEYQSISILDIGAGNCKLLDRFSEISESQLLHDKNGNREKGNMLGINKYLAIEKSQILISKMPKEVIVIGTDFNENTLIDKESDIVFCNPPYKDFAQWSERIIREANTKYIYLVIPKRWGKSKGIAEALKLRRAKVQIVGDFDFLNSEDRKARAKVSLVKVYLGCYQGSKRHNYNRSSFEGDINIDPFQLWFDENFKIQAEVSDDSWCANEKKEEARKQRLQNELIKGNDLVHTLIQLYNKDLENLIENYKKLTELDAEILTELDVKLDELLLALKEKIKGLKILYWKEVFDNFGDITKRLTSFTRQSLMDKLASNTNIDFTEGNIRSIVIWVIKNASSYFDSQMMEMYDKFTSKEGIKLYKSNIHWTHDSWRYAQALKEKGIKYSLDYRIILESYRDPYYRENKISRQQITDINDLIIVARNLGFQINDGNIPYDGFDIKKKEYVMFSTADKKEFLKKGTKTLYGKIDEVFCQSHVPNENGEPIQERKGVIYVDRSDEQNFSYYQYRIGELYHNNYVPRECDIFTTVIGYKNGNNHFQFNQKFIKVLNLEVSRLRGWIKSPQEATEEFDISLEEATSYWKSNFVLLPSHVSNLLPDNSSKEEKTPESTKPEPLNSENYSEEQRKHFEETGTLF